MPSSKQSHCTTMLPFRHSIKHLISHKEISFSFIFALCIKFKLIKVNSQSTCSTIPLARSDGNDHQSGCCSCTSHSVPCDNNSGENAPDVPINNMFASCKVLNLGTSSRIEVFQEIYKPLCQIWNGNIASFLYFIKNLFLQKNKGKRNLTGTSGIIMIDSKHIFTSINMITKTQVNIALTNCTDPRAMKNCKAWYQCLGSSILGGLKATIYFPKQIIFPNMKTEYFFHINKYRHGSIFSSAVKPFTTTNLGAQSCWIILHNFQYKH